MFTARRALRRALTLAPALVATVALAQQVSQSLTISINGKALGERAVIIGGKTYYPESALAALGVSVKRSGSAIALSTKGVAGGANQTAALEGCVGETLFNGALRVTLHSFGPDKKDGQAAGWTADLEFRNGTQAAANLYGMGVEGGQSWYVAYDDSTYPYYIIDSNGVSGGRDIPPGSSYRVKFNIGKDTSNAGDLPFDPERRPVKLLLTFSRASASTGIRPLLAATPGFRIKLDCKK